MTDSLEEFYSMTGCVMESPQGPSTAHLPSQPQQEKAGSLQATTLVIAGGCLEEEREFVFLQCCVLQLYSAAPLVCIGTHFTDERSGPREVR